MSLAVNTRENQKLNRTATPQKQEPEGHLPSLQTFPSRFFENEPTNLRAGGPTTSETEFFRRFLSFRKRTGGIPRSISKKDFNLFTSRALRRVCTELRMKPEDLEKSRTINIGLKKCLDVHYLALKKAGMPESMIGRRGHMFSVATVLEINQQSHTHFKSNVLQRVRKTAINQVFLGRYASIPEAKAEYCKLLRGARKLCGESPCLRPLVRTAALLVFTGNFKSLDHFAETYQKKLAECRLTFGADPESEGIVRSAALLLTMRRNTSVRGAKIRFDALTLECARHYPHAESKSELLKLARLLIFSGKYKSCASFDTRLKKVQSAVKKSLKERPELKTCETTIVNEVMAFKYRSATKAVAKFARYVSSAQEKFASHPRFASAAFTAALAVFRREFRDLNHWERHQLREKAA